MAIEETPDFVRKSPIVTFKQVYKTICLLAFRRNAACSLGVKDKGHTNYTFFFDLPAFQCHQK